METLLSLISFTQGIFLVSSVFVKSKIEICQENTRHKTSQYIHLLIGFTSIILAILKFYKILKIPIYIYIGIVLFFSITSIVFSTMDKFCTPDWVLAEGLLELLAVILVGLFIHIKNKSESSINNSLLVPSPLKRYNF